MLLMLLLWMCLVLGVAVGSYWLWAIVQSTRPSRLQASARQDNLPRASVNGSQKRYDPGPMPSLYWLWPVAPASLPRGIGLFTTGNERDFMYSVLDLVGPGTVG